MMHRQEILVSAGSRESSTNPSIFLRLQASDAEPRQIAWEEFSSRYSPVITAFARRLGARPQDVEDVVQDVLMGFFLKSPTFIYEPSKGRFRSYLKVCTYRALRKRLGHEVRLHGVPLDDLAADAVAVDQVWSDVWEQQQLRIALDEVRAAMGATKAFRAFEMYVVFDQPAQAVADKLDMHLNSVYRAKEQITRLLQEKLAATRNDD
jgi:RNA polymerase sigma factor (sigma-70 family)